MSPLQPWEIADTLAGMRPLRKAVFSLGSNLGDRMTYLQGALDALKDTPDLIVVDVSPVYETVPVGAPDGSPDYLNAVIVAETTLQAHPLLERCLAIEQAYDRKRTVVNGPRTLDVDLIILGRHTHHDELLQLPHPRAHERAFVLQPWLDIDPLGEIPGHGPITELVRHVDGTGIRRRDDLVLES